MCPNPTLFDFMEMKPQHYLHGKNCIQTRQGCSGESGPVTPHVSVALVGSIALVSLPPSSDLQAHHRVNVVFISIINRDGKPVSWEREHLCWNIYSWLLHGLCSDFLCSGHRGLQWVWDSEVFCSNWYSFLGSPGTTDLSTIRVTVTAFL